ncbi:aldo/keto reductase [Pedobacter jeongneungensis]|uniref:aldo/keto reductase n=1 Tax=Pedobacter jeongneungensis TaxID=947309 RepID=UPI000468DB2A|nr:aldo/keto reductase [Pedobacter jeongneungensis]
MEYRKLGNTELKLSAIAYGAFAIGGNMWGGNDRKDSVEAVKASIDKGITTIDTAPFYGFGLSEEIIGEAIKGYDRNKIQLLTKFGLVWDGSNHGRGEHFFDAENNGKAVPIYRYSTKASIIKEVEDSLKRLGTDYIDLLQQHWPDPTTPMEETMEAVAQLIKDGKILAAGLSNAGVNLLENASKVCQPASNQVSFSMLNRAIQKELIPYSVENNIGIIAYSPMERGLLSGKYFNNEKLKANDHRNSYFSQFDLEAVKTFLENITPIAEAKNASMAQLVLRWTTLQEGITVVLAGARNAEQAVSNAAAMDFEISNEELAFINTALEKL